MTCWVLPYAGRRFQKEEASSRVRWPAFGGRVGPVGGSGGIGVVGHAGRGLACCVRGAAFGVLCREGTPADVRRSPSFPVGVSPEVECRSSSYGQGGSRALRTGGWLGGGWVEGQGSKVHHKSILFHRSDDPTFRRLVRVPGPRGTDVRMDMVRIFERSEGGRGDANEAHEPDPTRWRCRSTPTRHRHRHHETRTLLWLLSTRPDVRGRDVLLSVRAPRRRRRRARGLVDDGRAGLFVRTRRLLGERELRAAPR